MCALCGALGEDHWAETPGRAARTARNALLARVLAPFGIGLEDWGGVVYALRGPDGTLAVADNVGVLWVEAERLAGRRLDPLDPLVLAALDA